MPNARSMAFGKNGTLFVGTRFPGTVYAVVDKGGKREEDDRQGSTAPTASRSKTARSISPSSRASFATTTSRTISIILAAACGVIVTLPKDEPHGWKFMKLGPDGWLYFQIGAPGNIVLPPYTHAQIVRLDPERKVLETVTMGVRNSVGMDFHPKTKQLWFTNNGRDWVGDELPNDTLHTCDAQGPALRFSLLPSGRSCST